MKKGIIYYTDSRLDEKIDKVVRENLLKAKLPITSVSLKPMDFGNNFVLDLEPGIRTYLIQILLALAYSTADVVFFCEHDVIYSKSHFDFTPPEMDIFYYNTNVWRWDYPKDRLISYEKLRSLSGMCVSREKAIEHYKERIKRVENEGWKLKFGFEPGTKRKRRGGITDDFCQDWESTCPNIDIRHKGTLTNRKCTLDSFKHKPKQWKERHSYIIGEWDLKKMFNI